jgi:CheY-like chemotaxis protein
LFGKKKIKPHVLLVDNFEQVRDVAQSVLESNGYTVTAVGDVGEALKALGKKMPDLIICEAELSGIGGIGLYHRLKKYPDTARIPFIFLTAYEHRKVEKELLLQDILIPKPVKWKDFFGQIAEFVNRRTPPPAALPQAVARQQPRKKNKQAGGEPASAKHVVSSMQTKTPSSRDTLQKTAARNVPQRVELKPQEEKKKRKRRAPLAILPEGHATRNFADPTSLFQLKQIKDLFSTMLKSFKSGMACKNESVVFPSSPCNWQEIIHLALQPRETHAFYSRPQEEVLLDLEVIESMDMAEPQETTDTLSEDDKLVAELMLEEAVSSDMAEVAVKSGADEPFLQPVPSAADASAREAILPTQEAAVAVQEGRSEAPVVCEEELPAAETAQLLSDPGLLRWQAVCGDYIWQSSQAQTVWVDKDEVLSTWEKSLEREKVVEMCHTMLSMAGLCFQAFGEEFSVAYVMVRSERDHIFFTQEEENRVYGIAAATDSQASDSLGGYA